MLGIGGLQEKVDSARHHGIKTLIVPLSNLEEHQRDHALLQLASAALSGTAQQEGPELIGVRCLEEAIRVAFEPVDGAEPVSGE